MSSQRVFRALISCVLYAAISFLLLFVLLQPSQWQAARGSEGAGSDDSVAQILAGSTVEQWSLISASASAAGSGAFFEQAIHSADSDQVGLLDSEDPNEEDPLLISPSRLPSRLGDRHLPESRSFSLRSESFIHRPPIA